MHTQQYILLGIMVVGGAAVIGSYIYGFAKHPGSADALWGGVTGGLRYLNFVTMILAVIGYFTFSYWLFFKLDPDNVLIADRLGFWLFHIIFIFILIPSALWMPLTHAYVAQPSPGLWAGVRVVLALVGIASLALLWAIIAISPREANLAYWFAVGGAAFFAVQTAVQDMLIWPALFSR